MRPPRRRRSVSRRRRSSATNPADEAITKASTPSSATSPPGQSAPGALDRPEDAEGREHRPDGELDRVLRHARERRPDEHPDHDHEHERGGGAGGRERDAPLRAPEGEDDERDLQPLEEDALERERERRTSRARRAPPAPPSPASSTSCANASVSSCSALKPLARRIALRSHCRPKMSRSAPTTSRSASIGTSVSAGPSAATTTASAPVAAADADQRRAPAARQPGREHDRQRLDELDRAGEEGREDEEGGGHASTQRSCPSASVPARSKPSFSSTRIEGALSGSQPATTRSTPGCASAQPTTPRAASVA